MRSSQKNKAFRGKTASGVLLISEILSLGINKETTNRKGSTSIFFNVKSDLNSVSAASRISNLRNKADRTVSIMPEEIIKMEKVVEK